MYISNKLLYLLLFIIFILLGYFNTTVYILNDYYPSSNCNNVKNCINLSDDIVKNSVDKYTEFPLNLLPEINQLATAELMFLMVIFNVFMVSYISTLDYNKYIPKNRFGYIIKLWLSRYIAMWSKSAKILMIVGWVGLFVSVIGSKIFLLAVIN